jgi:hypothetical protein
MELRRAMTTLAIVVFVLTASSVKKVAPHGAETTMTTLAFVVFDGLGCSLGGSLSGVLYKTSKNTYKNDYAYLVSPDLL